MGPHITQYYSILYSLTTFLYIVYSNLKFTCYVTIAYYAKLHQVFEGETEYARGWNVSTETWGVAWSFSTRVATLSGFARSGWHPKRTLHASLRAMSSMRVQARPWKKPGKSWLSGTALMSTRT